MNQQPPQQLIQQQQQQNTSQNQFQSSGHELSAVPAKILKQIKKGEFVDFDLLLILADQLTRLFLWHLMGMTIFHCKRMTLQANNFIRKQRS